MHRHGQETPSIPNGEEAICLVVIRHLERAATQPTLRNPRKVQFVKGYVAPGFPESFFYLYFGLDVKTNHIRSNNQGTMKKGTVALIIFINVMCSRILRLTRLKRSWIFVPIFSDHRLLALQILQICQQTRIADYRNSIVRPSQSISSLSRLSREFWLSLFCLFFPLHQNGSDLNHRWID